MVFDVAAAGGGVGEVARGEFVEDVPQGFVEDVGEDVEPAAVGHAHFDVFDSGFGARAEEGFEDDYEAFAAFEGEAFFTKEFFAEEFFKSFGLEELGQGFEAFFGAVVGSCTALFDFFFDPVTDLKVVYVHVFEADGPAVGGLEGFDYFAEGGFFAFFVGADVDGFIKVFFGEAEVFV